MSTHDISQLRGDTPSQIHRIPIEILIAIFRLSISDIEAGWAYYRGLRCLARVWKTWAELAIGTPEMWTMVDGADPRYARCLARSKNAPLDVIYKASDVGRKQGGQLAEEVWRAILQHVFRWKSASLDLSDRELRFDNSFLPQLEAVEAPVLRTLHLRARLEAGTHAIDLFKSATPALREVRLSGIAFRNWNSPFPRGLRVLSLRLIRHSGPSLDQTMQILGGCPELEELELCGITMLDETHPAPSPLVTLARLCSLIITLPLEETFHILNGLQAPVCTRMECNREGLYDDPPCEDLDLATICTDLIHPAFRSSLPTCREVVIAIWPRYMKLYSLDSNDDARKDMRVELEFSPLLNLTGLVSLLADYSAPTTSIRLSLNEVPSVLSDQETFAALWRLPGITQLSLVYGGDADPLLELLSKPEVVEGGLKWLLPRLEHVNVSGCSCTGETVVRLVETRNGARMGTGEGDERPMRLKSLYLSADCEVDAATRASIKQMLGYGA